MYRKLKLSLLIDVNFSEYERSFINHMDKVCYELLIFKGVESIIFYIRNNILYILYHPSIVFIFQHHDIISKDIVEFFMFKYKKIHNNTSFHTINFI